MPQIKIVNDTQVPLHIALTQVGPLHWQNNVEPGQTAVLKPGPVFFTIQARIARGVNNEYDNLQRFLPIAVVSVSVVTLGVGAVYFAGAYAAAGSASAVAANISAQLASKAPTVRKLYRYARKYQTVARIGNMVGIGGSVLAGKKVVAAEQHQAGEQQQTQSSMFGFMRKKNKKEEKRQTKESMKILQGLVAGSVVSSPGWFLNRDRTLRIVGGPRATEVDDLLIIETDTLEPFRIIEEDGKTLAKGQSQQEIIQAGQQAQLRAAAESAAAAAENQDPTHHDAHVPLSVDENSKLRRTKSTPDHAALAAAAQLAALDSDLESESEDDHHPSGDPPQPPGYSAAVKGKFAEWGASINGMTEEALQRSATMYSRFRSPKASGTTTPKEKAGDQGSKSLASAAQFSPAKEKEGILDYTSVAEKVKTDTKVNAEESSTAPDDDGMEQVGEVSPLTALLEMGFSPIEANAALRNHYGDLKASIEELLQKDGEALTQLATSTPLPGSPPAASEDSDGNMLAGADTVTTKVGTVPDNVSLAAKIPAGMAYSRPAAPLSPPAPSKPTRKVVGGEELETPHWTQKAQQTYVAATSSELGKFAQQQVIDRGLAFATGDIAGATSRLDAKKTVSVVKTATQKKKAEHIQGEAKMNEGVMGFLRRSKSEAVPSSSKKRV